MSKKYFSGSRATANVSPVRSEVGSIGPEAMLFSKAFYTVIDAVPGVL